MLSETLFSYLIFVLFHSIKHNNELYLSYEREQREEMGKQMKVQEKEEEEDLQKDILSFSLF